jgi:hypothetical protein
MLKHNLGNINISCKNTARRSWTINIRFYAVNKGDCLDCITALVFKKLLGMRIVERISVILSSILPNNSFGKGQTEPRHPLHYSITYVSVILLR